MKTDFACSSAMNTRGDLTDEQKSCSPADAATRCGASMRKCACACCNSEIMLERGMVPDSSTYRSVFCPEGGDAPWMLDQAG